MSFSKRFQTCFMVLLSVLVLAGCQKDDEQKTPNGTSHFVAEDCPLMMSYEMTTTTSAQAANPAEQPSLTTGEQTLSYPNFIKCGVEVCIAEDGQLCADIQMLPVPNAPNYPARTVGLQTIPEAYKVDRIEIRNGTATHFNAAGQVVATEFADVSSVDFYLSVIEDLSEFESLTAEQMGWVMQAFADQGFAMTTINDDLEMLTQPHADGSVSKVVLDKRLGVIRGQADYSPTGELLTKSNFSYAGEAGNVTVTGHRFVTYLTAPFSEKRMAITRRSKIENFTLTKNP